MKVILLTTLLIALAFSGCCSKTQSFKFGCQDKCIPDTVVAEKKEYIEQELQAIPEPPLPEPYKTVKIKINGIVYLAVDRENAAIMSANEISDKGYTKSLRTILYNMQNKSTEEKHESK